MILLLKLIFLTSVLVLGYTASSQEGMILYPIRQWAEKKKSKIYEPLFLCHWCAPSIYSSLGYLFIWIIGGCNAGFTWNQIAIYPLVVCGSSMTCGLIWATYKCIAEIDKNYRLENEWIESQDEKPVEIAAAEIVKGSGVVKNTNGSIKSQNTKKKNGKSK